MKKSKIEIILVMITIILSISAVSAADIDDSSDSAIQSIEKTAIDEVVSTDAVDGIQTAENNADVLATDGDGNFTELQTSVNTGMVVMDKDYARVEGENDISISGDVTIEGNGHKIDANNLGGIFNVNSGYTLTLIGVTLINGNAENGGAVYNNGGTLSISDSYFINNTATKSGGAIYNNGGTLDVTGSTFDGNDLTKRTTNGWGGAAIYDEGGSVLISGCTVTNNLKEIKHRGGTKTYAGDLSSAAVTSSGTLTVSDSYFANNSGCYGGAILCNENGILTVSGSRFENNLAFNGGAIDFAGQRYTITTSNFTGNSARGTGSAKSSVAYGGAICSQETSDDCIISDCRFEDNTAVYGGAISTDNSKISDCTFINNSADAKYAETFNGQSNTNGFAYGDAIYSDSSVDIADSTFTDNKGQFNTGVYVKDANVTGSSFTNTLIYADVEGSLNISDNQYDNEGSDIECWNADVYFDGVGDVPSFEGIPYIHAEITGFAQLQAMIDELPTTGGRLMLSGDVSKLDSEYESFANGIIISKNTNIFAEGYTISANTGKVFTVNEGAALTLDKANVVGDGTSAIVNNGKVTLKVASPSTFTNVGEFAIDNRGTLSQAGMTTFTQLNDLIALVNGGEISIGTSKITKADDEKATFADGIVVEKDLTITGYASSKRVISTYLDADNSGRIFSVNDGATLTLNKIILKNGNAENGGAVYVEANNNLIANTVDFIDNVASEYDGGAIYTVGGTIALTDCVLDGNDVTKLETSASQNRGGAAIYAKDAQVTLVNTNVINNGRSELDRSKGDMVNAVINLINSNAAITGGLFENNTGIYGGAIIANGDGSQTLTVSGATFKNNKAYNGGAIDISSMITDISDCTFDNNWVVGPGSTGYYGIGGAVATDGSGSFSLTDSNFTGNRATGLNASAGAVSAGLDQGCPATIDGCVFKENTAELKGGAVFIAGYDDDATISNCNFSDDNTAEIGGSLYNGGNLKLTNNVIEGDSGIYSSSAGKIDTHVWVIVNDNQDVTVEYYDTIPIVVKITDDNGNLIRIDEPTMEIDLGDRWTRYTLTLDEATGFYTMDNYLVDQKSGLLTPSRTTIGKYFSSYDANTNLNSSYVTMIKANPTVEVVYDNVTDLDDVVININVIGKEGAPKISWAATAATPFKIFVNNETYKVKITNGVGSVTIPNLPAGNYVINASWDGNTKYNGIEPQLYNLLVTPLKGTYTDLQAQIDAATGVLDLAYNFTYNADVDGANFINGVLIDKAITVNGNGYTISGSDAARIFNVIGGSLTLNNVSLINASADNGAAVYVGTGASLNIANSALSGNIAADGSAIYNKGTLNLDNVSIEEANAIVSSGKITSNVTAVFNNNEDIYCNAFDTINFTLTFVDDNNNIIRFNVNSLKVYVGNKGTPMTTLILNQETGIYEGSTTAITSGSMHLENEGRYLIDKGYVVNTKFKRTSLSQVYMEKANATLSMAFNNISYGEDAVIDVTLTDSKGNPITLKQNMFLTLFTIEVNGKTNKIEINNGKGDLTVSDLPGGEYVVTASFKGNATYKPVVATSTLKVSKVNVTEFTVGVLPKIRFGENVTLDVTLLGLNGEGLNETFNVIVNNTEYAVTVANGTGSFNISGLAPGHYSALGIFPGNDNYNGVYATGLFTVMYPNPILNVTADDISYGEVAMIEINLTEADGTPLAGDIFIQIEDVGFVLDIYITGYALIPVSNLPTNETGWKIYVGYKGDEDHYNVWNDTEVIKVAKADVNIAFESVTPEIKYGEDGIIKINITPDSATGNVTIMVDDVECGTFALDENADVTITLSGLSVGTHNINLTYTGDDNYNARTGVVPNAITVGKALSKVTIEPVNNVTYGNDVTIGFTVVNATTVRINVATEDLQPVYNTTIVVNDSVYTDSLVLSNVVPGNYIVVLYNEDNDNYEFSSTSANFTVDKAKSFVDVYHIDDVVYGNNVSIGFSVLNATTVYINVATDAGLEPVYGATIVVNDSEYEGSIVLPNLAAGKYVVVVGNDGNDNYTFSSDSRKFTVNKAETTMQTEITPDIKVGDEGAVIKVVLPENATGNVMLSIDGEILSIIGYELINGTANIAVPSDLLTAGKHSYYVRYDGDANYTSADENKQFAVSKVDPMVVIYVIENLDTKEPVAVSIIVGNISGDLTVGGATGQILIEGYGVARLVNLEDGIYTLDLIDITPGEYEINVTYFGDSKYNNATNSTKFDVAKRNAAVEITDVTANILGGQNATFTVNMNPDSANGNVTIYINGTEYATVVLGDEYANATVSIPGLGAGTYTIGVKYNGNDQYNASDVVNTTVTVAKAGSKVIIDPITFAIFGYPVEISYTVENETAVTYSVVNESGVEQAYDIIDGIIVLSGLSVGDYTVTIANAENDKFLGSSAKATFTVSETPTIDFNVTFPENSTDSVFSISVPEDAGGYLLVDIDGQHYYAPVKNGTATVVVPGLAPGNYTATVSYTGDDKYVNATTTKEVSIPSNLPEDALAIPESGDTETPSTYSISLPADADGFLIVDVDGTKYVAALQNGSASVTVPALSEGEHNVTVTYTGDGKYSSASKSTNLDVKKPVYNITSNKNVNVVYSSNAYYKVLVTRNGKAVGAGEKVTVKYNGKTYTVTTDKNGYATLKLDTKVKAKNYAITASYKGVTVKNSVNVKHVAKAKYIKVKKSKVNKIKVKTNKVNGKFLKGKKLTLKVNGKKIKAKINKKGVATFKIKKYVLKNLKVGKKYKYSISYGKDKITKKMKVKK